jgi:hypothetical protein
MSHNAKNYDLWANVIRLAPPGCAAAPERPIRVGADIAFLASPAAQEAVTKSGLESMMPAPR